MISNRTIPCLFNLKVLSFYFLKDLEQNVVVLLGNHAKFVILTFCLAFGIKLVTFLCDIIVCYMPIGDMFSV